MEKVIQYNGATVTVKRGNVRSRLRSTLLYNKLDISDKTTDEEWLYLNYFVRFLTQTTVKGNLGIDMPAPEADPAALKAGLERFLDADVEFYDEVIAALNEVDAVLNDPELSPDTEKND